MMPRCRSRPAALIAALIAGLALAGCAGQEDVRTVSYDYSGQGRQDAAWRAHLAAQDVCYMSGSQYAEDDGPPQVARQDGRFQATQAYHCVGTQGGP